MKKKEKQKQNQKLLKPKIMFNTNTITLLQKKSEDALKIFRNSVVSLESANRELRQVKALELEKKAKIEQQLADLDAIEKQNENFMNKINKLFEE